MSDIAANDGVSWRHGQQPGLPFPPEIRNKIYHLVLVDSSSSRDWKPNLVQPALTRVSRQSRSEALPLYYGKNQFKLIIPTPGCHGREDTWYRTIKMFRVFAAGGDGRPGTSWLRYIQRIWMVCGEPKSIQTSSEFRYLFVRYALGFRCGQQGSWKGNLVRGSDVNLSGGFVKRFLPLFPSRPRDDGERTAIDEMNWKNRDEVQCRLQDAIENLCVSGRDEMKEVAQIIPVRRVVDALCMAAMECKEARRRVEIFLESPD